MSQRLEFPDGFLWGASTSAHQVEGDTHNSWSVWEKENAKRLAEKARDEWESWQQKRFPEMFEPDNYISGAAADHYRRYEYDFDIAGELGHTAHRFSIEWSRIEPREGQFDEQAVEHYRQVVRALRERGMEPFVTLWHWPLPPWLAEQGGWENTETVEVFARYVERMAEALGDDVTFWITLNEPEVYAHISYLYGAWPPQKRSYFAYRRVIRNLVAAHTRAYTVIHKNSPAAQVCVAKHNVYFEAYRDRLVNRAMKAIADWWWNDWFLQQISGYQDVLTLNNYHHNRINYGFGKNADDHVSDLGWELCPSSLAEMARELTRKYRLPIYVTEHGLADADDSRRAWFLTESLKELHAAIEDGADVRGYLHWSLLDNFEWDKGFWPRFGLVAVDYATQEREVRDSARMFARICRENAVEMRE